MLPLKEKFKKTKMSKSNIYNRLNGVLSSAKTSLKPIIPITSSIKPAISTTLPDPILHSKIQELLDEKDSQQLVENFKSLSQFPSFRDNHREIYNLTIHRLALAKQYPLIEQALDSQKVYFSSEGFASRIIYLYGKYGMFDHAYKVFDELPDRGVKSFNVLLGAASNSGKYDKVLEFFRELPVLLSIEPNVESYNTTMHALCKLGRVLDAESLIDEMEGNGLKPSLVSFNTLLSKYYEDGDCDEGDKIWERMVESKVVPNILSYNFKLQGLIKNDKLPEALELAMQLKEKGVRPNVSTFNAVIHGLIKDDDLECVKEWYGRLIKNRCKPNKTTFSLLVPFLCQKGDYELAFEVCESMINRRNSSIDEATLQSVVDGLVKNSMADKAKVLVELGLSPSHASYNLVLPDTV